MSNNIISPIDQKIYNKSNGHFTRHLREHGLTYQQYYETYVTKCQKLCPYCSKPCHLKQSGHSYSDTCGNRTCVGKRVSEVRLSENPAITQLANERRCKTNLIKYGVSHVSYLPEVKQKTRLTEKAIRADGTSSKQVQQEKTRATKLQRYGNEFYNNMPAITAAKIKHDKARKLDIRDKQEQTCLNLFGVRNTFLLPSCSSNTGKANNAVKAFALPSGRVVGLRGYEPMAVETLLKVYSENKIAFHDHYSAFMLIPCFQYICVKGRLRRYYPDILIADEKLIIEIKSQWWYDGNGVQIYSHRLYNNEQKREAVIEAGYNFQFWVYGTNNTIPVII